MDWYKHKTGSHDDPDISDAMDEFGPSGYSVFFITLEIYGQEFNHLDSDGWLTVSMRFLSRKLRQSSAKVEQILNFYSERERILLKTTSNKISINCPKYIDIASNWVKRKSGTPTEALQRPYVAPTAIEVEEEEKKKQNKKRIKNIYGGFVELSEEEHQKLSTKFNSKFQEVLDIFNLKIESKGLKQWRKEHKSDYATILYWDRQGWIFSEKKKGDWLV